LRLQLNALADRIDRGYNVDVRTGELPAGDDEEGEEIELDEETRAAAEEVQSKQRSLQFMNVTGKPILHLEQPDEPGDRSGDE
jgi:hypothetical protein